MGGDSCGVNMPSAPNGFNVQREVQLRFLNPSDIPEVKRLCAEWFPIEYPDSWYQDITSNPKFYSLAATYSSGIIGLIVSELKPRSRCNREDADLLASHFPPSTQLAYILSLGVISDFRRHGVASLLLDSLLSYLTSGDRHCCKAVYLHVLTANATAIRFYERRQFRLHNFLPYYYSIKSTPRDGYSYVLYLNGGQPPMTFMDYIKQMGAAILWMQPCAIPKRLLQTAYNLWRRLVYSSSNTSHETHISWETSIRIICI